MITPDVHEVRAIPTDFLPRHTQVVVLWEGHSFAGRVRTDLGDKIRVELHGCNIRTFPRKWVKV